MPTLKEMKKTGPNKEKTGLRRNEDTSETIAPDYMPLHNSESHLGRRKPPKDKEVRLF